MWLYYKYTYNTSFALCCCIRFQVLGSATSKIRDFSNMTGVLFFCVLAAFCVNDALLYKFGESGHSGKSNDVLTPQVSWISPAAPSQKGFRTPDISPIAMNKFEQPVESSFHNTMFDQGHQTSSIVLDSAKGDQGTHTQQGFGKGHTNVFMSPVQDNNFFRSHGKQKHRSSRRMDSAEWQRDASQKRINFGTSIDFGTSQKGIDFDIRQKNMDFGSSQMGMDIGIPKQGMDFGTSQKGVGFGIPQQGINFASSQKGIDFGITQQGMDFGTSQKGMDFGIPKQGMDFGTSQKGIDFSILQQGMDFGQHPVLLPSSGNGNFGATKEMQTSPSLFDSSQTSGFDLSNFGMASLSGIGGQIPFHNKKSNFMDTVFDSSKSLGFEIQPQRSILMNKDFPSSSSSNGIQESVFNFINSNIPQMSKNKKGHNCRRHNRRSWTAMPMVPHSMEVPSSIGNQGSWIAGGASTGSWANGGKTGSDHSGGTSKVGSAEGD